MSSSNFVFAFFVIFAGASFLATIALYTRQSMLVAYLLLGMVVGPFGTKLLPDTAIINEISSVGIMFLLFLLGLNMRFKSLLGMLKGAVIVTVLSSIVFAGLSILVLHLFHFSWQDAILVGVAMMFSSTIVALKLLPTTALHHQRIGDVMISVLLMQDVIAILVLLFLGVGNEGAIEFSWTQGAKTVVAFPVLIALAYFGERYVLHHLFRRFDRIHEYLFLLAIGWCLGFAELAEVLGVSYEIGAFIAGISLAASPISQYIAECLKPLRDFFLIIFFFAVGASFNFHAVPEIWMPVLALLIVVMVSKPTTFLLLLKTVDESRKRAWETGVRLGQASEFSLLVAILAYRSNLISQHAYVVIQAVTILSFVVSSYLVVVFYPSPMSLSNKLRRD